MNDTTFEHEFKIGDEVLYPEAGSLEKGRVDEVIYRKQERFNQSGDVEYLIVPLGHSGPKSKRHGITKSGDDIVSNQ